MNQKNKGESMPFLQTEKLVRVLVEKGFIDDYLTPSIVNNKALNGDLHFLELRDAFLEKDIATNEVTFFLLCIAIKAYICTYVDISQQKVEDERTEIANTVIAACRKL